jgi:hypothetical protein
MVKQNDGKTKQFPFDPYTLPKSRGVIQPYYRTYKPLEEADSDSGSDTEDEEADEDGEEQEEDLEDQSFMDTLPRRSRSISTSSSTTTSRRTRTFSFTDVLSKELGII